MIVFVVPLKSAKVSKSWDYVSSLFERCLKSLCNQTLSSFKVIVVCHEKPNIKFNHPYVTYVEVKFTSPKPTDYDEKRLDKIKKAVKGLTLADELQPSHTMVVDADDCVSKRLAEFVHHNSQCNGWFIDKGYRYDDGSEHILTVNKNFYKLCATSIIVRRNLLEPSQTSNFESLLKHQIDHSKATENLASRGKPLERLPFTGAVYINVSNGDNLMSQRSFYNKLSENPRIFLSPIKKK
ncbi:glycosyltransferase family 2 protein [Coleofasciculus sp. F4-SAH-05]|uniref:glycosyltransferase family 2 protein n=1 Tax=Coleofasciculus TaxID=669368 RepID=UPI0032F339FC